MRVLAKEQKRGLKWVMCEPRDTSNDKDVAWNIFDAALKEGLKP